VANEVTMIEILIRQLKVQGFTEVTLALGHLGHLIETYVGDGSQWGTKINCWHEDRPLGTAGPLVCHRDELPEDFVVLNADLLCDIDMGEMLDQHRANGASLTIASSSRWMKVDFGVLEVRSGRLESFEEKPQFEFKVSMGIYCVSRSLLYAVEPTQLGFDDLLRELLTLGDSPYIYPFDGYWLDIGRPEDYELANRDFPALREKLWRLKPVDHGQHPEMINLTPVTSNGVKVGGSA
jgi:mannose-1-phosphate guanylyltransferase